jgi:hypothetical protein
MKNNLLWIACILVIIFYFKDTFKIILVKFTLPELLTAVGTISTAALSFYFGIFGNHQTRLFIKNREKLLNKEALNLLADLPEKKKEDRAKQLADFEKSILDNAYITQKKIREYNSIVKLSKKFRKLPGNEDDKKIFDKIISKAKKLSQDPDDSLLINKLLKREAKAYWNRNIFRIMPMQSNEHQCILIYSDSVNSGGKGGNVEDINKVYGLIDEFIRTNRLKVERQMFNNDNSECEIIYPSEYRLIKRKNSKIEIELDDKQITLYYKKPKLVSCKKCD